MSELKEKIMGIIGSGRLAVMATVTGDGKPMGRYVMTKADSDMNLYVVTSVSSRKTDQIRHNPYIHFTLGFEPGGEMNPYITYLGTGTVLTDKPTREAHWHESLTHYFKNVDDPEYCVIKIVPKRIEYWAGWEPEVWEP